MRIVASLFRTVTSRSSAPPAQRRAVRAFWVLVLVAVAASGSVSAAVTAAPGALTALRFAVSVVVGIAATALAVRLMLALGHRTPEPGPLSAQPDGDGQALRRHGRLRTARVPRP